VWIFILSSYFGVGEKGDFACCIKILQIFIMVRAYPYSDRISSLKVEVHFRSICFRCWVWLHSLKLSVQMEWNNENTTVSHRFKMCLPITECRPMWILDVIRDVQNTYSRKFSKKRKLPTYSLKWDIHKQTKKWVAIWNVQTIQIDICDIWRIYSLWRRVQIA
jgi:hypothetical protein